MGGSLDNAARRLLQSIALRFGPAPFTPQEAAAACENAAAMSEVLLALRRLLEHGEIGAFQKTLGGLCFAVPFERSLQIAAELAEAALADARNAGIEAESDGRADGKDMALDLLMLLDDIERRDIRLTRKGKIEQKSVERWSRLVRRENEAAAALLTASCPYPAAVAIALDLMMRLGLIRLDGETVQTDAGRIGQWTAGKCADCRRKLYAEWLGVWCPDDGAARLIAMALPALPGGEWFCAEKLLSRAAAAGAVFGGKAGGDNTLSGQTKRFLAILAEFGWLETGTARSGETVFRSLLSGEKDGADEKIVIQSDLDVVVPPGVSYDAHRMLLAFAEPVSRDRAVIYRLSKNRSQLAWRQGWTWDRAIAGLERLARFGVPEPVKQVLAEWERQEAGIRLEPSVTLRFRDRDLAKEIEFIPEMQSYFGAERRLPDGSLVVAADQAAAVRAVLEKYGYYAGPGGNGGGPHFPGPPGSAAAAASSAKDDGEGSGKGLFRSKFDTSMYRRLEGLPELGEWFPGIDGVPTAWLNACRRCHPSTAAAIVRKAMEWQCYVKVRTKERDRMIVPAGFIGDGAAESGFRGIENGRPAAVRFAEIEGIQLALAGEAAGNADR